MKRDLLPSIGERPVAAQRDDIGANVDAQMLQIAYDRLPLALALTVVVVTIFVGLLWPHFPPTLSVLWSMTLVGVAGLRYLGLLAYQRHGPHAHHDVRWKWWFMLGAIAAGASWTFGPVALIVEAGHPESYLLALTMLAVSAVSMASLSAQAPAMWGFQVVALLPAAGVLAATGGDVERLAALIVLAGMFSLMVVGRGTNATIRSQIEAELRLAASVREADAAREAAESASRAKSRFLANMSHELRTPLNAVIGAAQLMRADGQDIEQRIHLVDAIQRSGTNLLGLIENILDLSRIEAGEMKLQQRDFHLVECVEAALATAGLAARAKGLQLVCIVEPALMAWRRGDESRLRQVLLNLLGNAVKFTAEGEVVLRLQAGAAAGHVCITLTDTGIGIDAAALPHVFEPFLQADQGSDRRFGGSGLGLAIVQQTVQAMGGQVSVDSQPGRGSCFTLELPLPAAARPAAEPPPLGLRVAYVEAHEAGAQALHALLLRMGCQPRRCTDAGALRRWAAETAGDDDAWLLVDVDSAAAGEWLEQAANWLDPQHVVGLSREEVADAQTARTQCRLPRQIIKPVTRSALASRLMARSPVAGSSRPMPLEGVTIGQLQAMPHVLVVEDDLLNQTIVGRLLQHAGYRVSTADDGRAAIDALRTQAVDLVLMDWQMPDMDGVEVTRRVRAGDAGEAARTLPIVALTANAFAEDRDICLAAGMNDFLTKPVNAGSLVRTIERWVRHDAAADAKPLPQQPERPKATVKQAASARAEARRSAAAPDYDPTVLAALPMVADGSDPDYGRQVLAMFIEATPEALSQFGQAAARGDARTLQRLVHTLKSSSAAVGALALAELARAAEDTLRSGDATADLPAALRHAFARFQAQVHAHQAELGGGERLTAPVVPPPPAPQREPGGAAASTREAHL